MRNYTLSIVNYQLSTIKAASWATYVLAVLGLLYLMTKGAILSTNIAGLIVQAGAVALMIWARVTFGLRSFHAQADTTEGNLVTHGPYRRLRHPIYASIIYFVWTGVLSHISLDACAAALLISAGLFARMLLEEKFLREKYPEYPEYCRSAKRVIPFVL